MRYALIGALLALCGCEEPSPRGGFDAADDMDARVSRDAAERDAPSADDDAGMDARVPDRDAAARVDAAIADAGVLPFDGAADVQVVDASQVDAATSCATQPHVPTFAPERALDRVLSAQGQIMTANIRSIGTPDAPALLVAEPLLRQVSLVEGCNPGCQWTPLSSGLRAPVRAAATDLDRDGDRDLLIADIGEVRATTDPVGRVVALENTGGLAPRLRVIVEGIGRVACAEPADLDGDHDIDIAVCEFGAQDGRLFWLERVDGSYVTHVLRSEAGSIHAFPTDVDGDADQDLIVALSQTAQRVLLYRNDGAGHFAETSIFQAEHEGFGLNGIEITDIDGDNDSDVLVSGGDYLDDTVDLQGQGLIMLINDGHGAFSAQRLLSQVGVYATRAIDMDGDCDRDVVVAALNLANILPIDTVTGPALSWLENAGDLTAMTQHTIAGAADHAVTLEAIPLAPDARPTIVSGSFTPGLAQNGDERLMLLRPAE